MGGAVREAGRWWLAVVAFWGLVVGVAFVMGATSTESSTTIQGPTWGEHLDLAKALITVLFGLGVWFSAQKLARIEKKFDLLFQWKDTISKDFAALQAEHKLLTDQHHPHRRVTDRSDE